VKRELLRIRTEIHKAIKTTEVARPRLRGEARIRRRGAPEMNSENEVIAGAQESRWLVTYVLNPDDPS
jgi:hypothetical protein